MTRGGEGVQPGNDEFPEPGSCIEAGGETSKHSGVERIPDLELLVNSGDEVDSIWLPLLSLGRRGCKPFSSLESGLRFQRAEPPLQTVQNVPGPNAIDVVGNGGSGVGTGQAGNEGGDGDLIGWSSQLLRDAPHITEYVVYEKARAIRLPCGLRPRVRHDIKNPLQLFRTQLGDVAATDIRGRFPPS